MEPREGKAKGAGVRGLTSIFNPRRIVSVEEFEDLKRELEEYLMKCRKCGHTYHGQAQAGKTCTATITVRAGTVTCNCEGETD